MAKVDKKIKKSKYDEKLSINGSFEDVIKASVSPGRYNPLDPSSRKLYIVTFDKNNNPSQAKLAPMNSGKGHGFGSWDRETFYTKFVYVEALNTAEALKIGKEIADKRIQNNT